MAPPRTPDRPSGTTREYFEAQAGHFYHRFARLERSEQQETATWGNFHQLSGLVFPPAITLRSSLVNLRLAGRVPPLNGFSDG